MMPGPTIIHLQIRKGFTLGLLLTASLSLFSQYVPPTSSNATIDSLVNVLNNRPGSKSKLQALNKLAWEEFTRSRGTGADRDRLIIRYIEEAISFSKQTKNQYEECLPTPNQCKHRSNNPGKRCCHRQAVSMRSNIA